MLHGAHDLLRRFCLGDGLRAIARALAFELLDVRRVEAIVRAALERALKGGRRSTQNGPEGG
jgi:hypothetical protein